MTGRRSAPAGITLVGLLLVAGAVTGCTAESDDRPHVMVTTNILGDVTSELVGDAAQVTTLMKPNADPHSFEISAPGGRRAPGRGPGRLQRAGARGGPGPAPRTGRPTPA